MQLQRAGQTISKTAVYHTGRATLAVPDAGRASRDVCLHGRDIRREQSENDRPMPLFRLNVALDARSLGVGSQVLARHRGGWRLTCRQVE